MSVKSKMTAIADKIRALLGISGTMGLDAMSANLATIQTDISGAFTAVGNKGGTVPSSKVSGNLASAINSIPAGVTVRTTSGSFSTDSNGTATVNCGFQPDLVYVTQGYVYQVNGYLVSANLAFHESSNKKLYTSFWNEDDVITDIFATRNANGFSVEMVTYDGSWNPSPYNAEFEYTAVKYT